MSALVDGFQYFWRFHRLVKLAFLLKSHSILTESGISQMRESGDFVKIRSPSACACRHGVELLERDRHFAMIDKVMGK